MLDPGQGVEIDAYQGFGFAVMDARGDCVGIVQARESRNSFSFGDGSAPVTGEPANDNGGQRAADPRTNKDYSSLPMGYFSTCAVDHGEGSSRYYDCLDDGLFRESGGDQQQDQTPTPSAGGCSADRQTIVAEYTDIPATVTITNTGSTDLNVYWITYSGTDGNYDNQASPQSVVQPGQSAEINAYRGFGFSIQDESGTCLGIVRASESRNGFSFGDGSVQIHGDAANDNDPRVAEGGTPVSSGEGCSDDRQGIVAGYTQNPASVSIANTGSGTLLVYWINYSGEDSDYDNAPEPQEVLQPGQTAEIDAYQGFAFRVLDERGTCLGLARARESRNSFSFGG